MKTPSRSSHEKTRRGSGRTVPRRHQERAEVDGQYDSSDFPVLLRMPDISGHAPEPVELPLERGEPAVEGSHGEVSETVPTEEQRSRKERKRSTPSSFAPRTTGHENRRFWTTLAPKIAIGGMLLSVTVLCVVVLQRGAETAPETPMDAWTAETTELRPLQHPPVARSPQSPVTDESWSTGRENSLAIRPEAPREPVPAWKPVDVQPLASDSTTRPPLPSVTAAPLMEPVKSKPPALDKPVMASPPSTQSHPVQGWPDETQLTPAAEMETELNSPIGMSPRSTDLPARNSSPSVGGWPGETNASPERSSAGARLSGTVEIPTPQADYRL